MEKVDESTEVLSDAKVTLNEVSCNNPKKGSDDYHS